MNTEKKENQEREEKKTAGVWAEGERISSSRFVWDGEWANQVDVKPGLHYFVPFVVDAFTAVSWNCMHFAFDDMYGRDVRMHNVSDGQTLTDICSTCVR